MVVFGADAVGTFFTELVIEQAACGELLRTLSDITLA